MYGLEKNEAKKFDFDLEIEMKKDPKKAKELFEKITQQVAEIKTTLRKGEKSEDFDRLGIILHGYTALQKVLEKAVKS